MRQPCRCFSTTNVAVNGGNSRTLSGVNANCSELRSLLTHLSDRTMFEYAGRMTDRHETEPNEKSAKQRVSRNTVVALVLSVIGMLATCLRFGPRDGVQWLAPVFYGTPQPVIVGSFALAWLLLYRQRDRLRSLVGVVALLHCAVWATDWNWPAEQTTSDGAITLGFWNVASCGLGRQGILEEIQSWDADLIGLAESGVDDEPNFWDDRFDDYKLTRFPRGIRLLSRYEATKVTAGKLGPRSNYGIAQVSIDGQVLYVVMADIISTPTAPRGPIFRELLSVISELPPGPIILMGDLNTPSQSVHFDEVRTAFRNAFEERGIGFYYSWPMICPVLSLDHVWANNEIRFQSCSLKWTRHSDHRPLLTTFDFVSSDLN